MEYTIVYSDRKTVCLNIKNAKLIVRAPRGLDKAEIEKIVSKHMDWINKKIEYQRNKAQRLKKDTAEDVQRLKKEAREYFAKRTEEISNIMGINYSRVKITSAAHRFGSCSSEGNICYSYRLMKYPERAREYVIVHELAHRLEMNHSKKFYNIIAKYMPDYKERRRLLK